jgi:hypothetical protein
MKEFGGSTDDLVLLVDVVEVGGFSAVRQREPRPRDSIT